MKYLDEKQLTDGSTLKLKTWVSDHVEPGRRMYQLELVGGGLTTQFPTSFEDYTETDVRGFYESINSRNDFTRIRNQHDE